MSAKNSARYARGTRSPQIQPFVFLCTPTSVCARHTQEALVYLGFPAVPSQTLPLDRAACLAKEYCLSRGPTRDAEDTLFAARLYGSIADISIKVKRRWPMEGQEDGFKDMLLSGIDRIRPKKNVGGWSATGASSFRPVSRHVHNHTFTWYFLAETSVLLRKKCAGDDSQRGWQMTHQICFGQMNKGVSFCKPHTHCLLTSREENPNCCVATVKLVLQTGMGGNLAFINRLERVITRRLNVLDQTHEGVRLLVNLANEVSFLA